MEESKFSEYVFRVPANELFKKFLSLPEILIYGIHMDGEPETTYSNENEFTIKRPIEGSEANIDKFKLIEKELNNKIIYDFEYDYTEPVINQNGRLVLLFEEIAPEKVKLKILDQIQEPRCLEHDLIMGLEYNYGLIGKKSLIYYYTFSNNMREVFELLLDLPSLLLAEFEITEDSNENESIVKFAMLSHPELYKFKIIEKEPNRMLVYDYDFMETYVGVRGRLTLIFDEINPEKVNLKVENQILDSRLKQWEVKQKAKLAVLPPKYHHLSNSRTVRCKPNWLGECLDEKLRRQDIHKIFVKYRGKRILVQDGSLGGLSRGFTLDLNALNITDIKNEVEGLENFMKLTDLYLGSNNIKEITGLDKLVNLANLYLEDNKIEWISGLENLSNLQRLYLSENNIREIEGLETLTNLRILHLNDNKISKIRGMENLEKLQHFEIKNNKIPDDIIDKLGGYQKSYLFGKPLDHMRFPQRFVRYCRKSNIIAEPEKRFQIKENVLITKLKEFAEVSQKIRLSMLRNALDLDKRTFDNKIFKWAKEFNFKIDGDFIIIEGDVLEFINSLDNKFKDWEKGSKKI